MSVNSNNPVGAKQSVRRGPLRRGQWTSSLWRCQFSAWRTVWEGRLSRDSSVQELQDGRKRSLWQGHDERCDDVSSVTEGLYGNVAYQRQFGAGAARWQKRLIVVQLWREDVAAVTQCMKKSNGTSVICENTVQEQQDIGKGLPWCSCGKWCDSDSSVPGGPYRNVCYQWQHSSGTARRQRGLVKIELW